MNVDPHLDIYCLSSITNDTDESLLNHKPVRELRPPLFTFIKDTAVFKR